VGFFRFFHAETGEGCSVDILCEAPENTAELVLLLQCAEG